MESVFSENNFVEYRVGTANIILTASHGGSLKPQEIPVRDAGAFLGGSIVYAHGWSVPKDYDKYPVRMKKDLCTQEIALATAKYIHQSLGKQPHVIINHLHRSRMDPNCTMEKGCFGNKMAEDAWTTFHSFIETAQCTENNRTGAAGLVLDIHGQVHKEDWVELGYCVSRQVLNSFAYTAEMTSLFSLFRLSKQTRKRHISELISGPYSLGAFLSNQSYSVVPSPEFPSPGAHNYYTGGLITESHGSKNGGSWDAIQVECPASVRKPETVDPFSQSLAQSVISFMQMHYA